MKQTEEQKQDFIKLKKEQQIVQNPNDIQIKLFEKITGFIHKETIFDSNLDDWSKKSSVFDKKVFRRANLAFVVEDIEGNVIGGFIKTSILGFYDSMNKKLNGLPTIDKDAFFVVCDAYEVFGGE